MNNGDHTTMTTEEEIKKAIDGLEGDELVKKVWQLMNTAWKDGMRYGLASED